MNLRTIKKTFLFVLRNIPVKKVIANISTLPVNQCLDGKIAIITGGTGGIGIAIAQAFLKSGISAIVITGRNETRLNQAKIELDKVDNAKGKVYTCVLNNKDIDSFDSKLDEILSKTGHIDILVNNAGVIGGYLPNACEAEYDNVMDTNLKGAFFLSQTVAKYMIAHKINGNILNICSSSSIRPANSAYALSKWGLQGLTLGLAKSLVKHGIIVNGIAPGPTATPMLDKIQGESIDNKYNPIGRMIMPEEIANMAVFLTSNYGRTIVGDVIYMSGGAGLITYDDVSYDFD